MIITASPHNASLPYLLAALLAALGSVASGQEIYDSGRLVDRATAARAAGDYATAIQTLEIVVARDPAQLPARLLLAETLAWAKRFAEAEREYRRALDQVSSSHDGKLGLARVLLWQGRYSAARPLFLSLTTANPHDLDAAEGAATAAYWSGDNRTARREFAAILRQDPKRETVRRSLAEIDATARPLDKIDLDVTDDDQPYRFVRATASSSLFTDPLTRWDATAGSWWMHASRSGIRSDAPFFRIGNETTFPAWRLVTALSLGAIRHPDGAIRPLGSAAVSLRVSPRSTIAASVDQREMLTTATAIDRHISSRAVALQWHRQADHQWSASTDIRQIQYSDANRGWALTGYVLAPIATIAQVTISGGASAAMRDTRTSRFYVESVLSVRGGNEFLYSYRGAYTPYWTPRRFRETRGILATEWDLRRTHFRIQADGGITRDRATNFGPDSGTTAFPTDLYAFEFGREYRPLHLQMTASRKLPAGMSIEAAIERNATVFYKANGIRASLVRRR